MRRASIVVTVVVTAILLLVFATPVTPDQLRAIYVVVVGSGLHALWRVAREWRAAARTGSVPGGTFKSRGMRLVDALLGSAIRLFVGVFSVPLFVVVAIEAVGTAKRLLTGA
jgi:hypothetical protein